MKKILSTLILLSICSGCVGQVFLPAQITFKIIDDSGAAVRGASVGMATYDHTVPGEIFGTDVHKSVKGFTDEKGIVTLRCASYDGDFGYSVHELPGYYLDQGNEYHFKEKSLAHWEPWNPTIQVVFKPIIKPIAMYAKNTWKLIIPENSKSFGYDLLIGDWVAPYGKGSISDFIFKLDRQFTKINEPFDSTLHLAFSNPDDGIQSILADRKVGSELFMPRFAPDTGYMPELTKRMFREKGKPINTGTPSDQNYFFRVRTMKRDGKITSALYGKIQGNFNFDLMYSSTAILTFSYCLNPQSNDRNMEFNPKKNLLKGLKISEQITSP